MIETKEKTVLKPAVGAARGQSIPCMDSSIADHTQNCNDNFSMERHEEMIRRMERLSDPDYLPTVTMQELYETAYQSKPPIVDGLLYPGTYLFSGASKIGKSFLMAQLAYHVSTGQQFWGYNVR